MGAYNTLTIEWNDDNSEQIHVLLLQFKYGEVWQYNYKIGDSLRWGEQNLGDKEAKEVLVEAIAENVDIPIGLVEEFEIFIRNNIILSAIPLKDKKKYFNIGSNYIVLKK